MSTHFFLSPHLDDAALSCGGFIHRLTRLGENVVVITVCAGDPPPGPLSVFAESLHARWQTSTDVVAARRAEDVQALAQLNVRVIHWDIADCIYRATPDGLRPYNSEAAIFGELHAAEDVLINTLAERLRALPAGPVYVPYTLGQHVDHQLTRRAAERAGRVTAYYEDYPYAESAAVSKTTALIPELMLFESVDLAAKARAIAAYTSQISSFWPTVTAMETALANFARRVGDGVLAERLWRVSI